MMNKPNSPSQRMILTIAITVYTMLLGVLFVAGNTLLSSQILPCTYLPAQSLVLAVCVMLILQFLAGAKIFPRYHKPLLIIDLVLLLLAVWLGSYILSPFGFSDRRNSFLGGFWVTTASRGRSEIASGEVISLTAGSAVAISPILPAGDVRCDWSSANGGALDDPQSCDMFYVPPMSDYDILKISVRPGCGLPNSIGQIKVSILP
jgi:hypothetical protein